MDLQAFIDTMSDMSRSTRADYHLTLGTLTEALRQADPDMPIEFDDGSSVGEEDSYRGYYADLAFSSVGTPSTVADVLAACERAAANIYQGYKGGDYTYDPRTPLWRAEYGCCGSAIVTLSRVDGKLILVTKDVG